MDKRAYLDAMGITRWVVNAHCQSESKVVLVDNYTAAVATHPIVDVVLDLLNVVPSTVRFSGRSDQQEVLWDMRTVKIPAVASIISSPSLVILEQQLQAKKELWQAICSHNSQ